MEEFIQIILGSLTFGYLLGYAFWIVIGLFVSSYIQTDGRNKTSTNTPFMFSWKFWFADNWKKLLFSGVVIFVLIRLYDSFYTGGLNEFAALMLGYTGDGISGFAKDKSKLLNANREKFLANERQ
jgi:hypothetical protein